MQKTSKKLNTGQIAILMIAITAIAKILGFVRELLLANFYGTGIVIDAFCMAQDIPDTVFATVIQLVGTAFLPIYSRKVENNGKEDGDKFTSQIYNFLLISASIMIILCLLFPNVFIKLFAPGFSQEAVQLTKFYLRIASFMLIGHVTITVFEPYLRYNGSYLLPVIFGFFQSTFVIIFTYISFRTEPKLLIWGIPIGIILQGILLIIYSTKAKKYHYSPSLKLKESIKEVLVLALPILISSLAFRLNSFFDRMLASNFAAGSISALRYGHLILSLISVFSYSLIASIVYPKYNKLAAKRDYKGLSKISGESINYTLILTIPIMIGCMVFSTPIVSLIFERGAFDSIATATTSSVFFWYAMGLPFNGAILLITYVFYSLQDIKPTVYSSIISIAINVVLNFILSHFMRVQGLALATTIAAIVNTLALIIIFRKKHPEISLLNSYKKIILTCLSALISVGTAYVVFTIIGNTILNFLLTIIVAMIIYIILIIILKVVDYNMVKSVFKFEKKQKSLKI